MLKKFCTLFWILFFFKLEATISQTTCIGSLGVPILNITFGQGSNPGAPFSTSVPGANTSYIYSAPTGNPASNTVFDGQYALVNSVPSNPAWLTGGDHTNSGFGYMAFFNAAPTPGEFYSQTVTGLCAGTTYEFAAWILNAINSDILPNAVPPNVTFKIFNPANLLTPLVTFSTGDIPGQNTILWRRFSTLFTMPTGINSVILVLSNNNVGGTNLIGNDMAIDDITFRACGPLTVASFSGTSVLNNLSICNNISYTLYGTVGSGINTPAYQWQISTDNGVTWLDISGANSLNYISTGSNGGLYKFRLQSQETGNIGSSFCKFYSTPIDLTVTNCAGTKIINDYTPILFLDVCNNKIAVVNSIKYNIGDTVLLIQMKGAIIDSTNTTTFGNIIDFKSAGNYEFNYVKSKVGNIIELKNKMMHTFEIPNGKVQLIRVPYFNNYVVTDTLTCLPWDGSKGGVLVLNVQNNLTLNNPIDVSGKGFRGGVISNNPDGGCGIGSPDYYYPLTQTGSSWSSGGAEKGEGISIISTSKGAGKGNLANGGGGGNKHNAGGGGGSNYSIAGKGGNELQGCNNLSSGGIGGLSLANAYANFKIFIGGGGGRGDDNNGVGTIGENGGGIAIVSCTNLTNNGFSIKANGRSQTINGTGIADGAGGGGAGGAILVNVQNYINNINFECEGGNGGNQQPTFGCVGTGGGGSGGYITINQPSLPPQVSFSSSGGKAGKILTSGYLCSNTTYGATDGNAGGSAFNLILPISIIPFTPNIDSVKFISSPTSCNGFNFNGLSFTNTAPIVTWQWNFGDGFTATGQNTVHTYTSTNVFAVTLVVTDINGCKDSVVKNIVSSAISLDAGLDKTFCGAQNNFPLNSVTNASGAISYSWSSNPTTTITNSNTANATAIIANTTTFFVTATDTQGCTNVDSVKVFINPIPIVKTLEDTSYCKGTSLQLSTTPGLNTYQWTNGLFVNDSTIANPFFTDTLSHILVVTGYNGFCYAKDTILVTVKPNPIVKTIADTLICSTQSIVLTTTGANSYSWSPNVFLNNYNSPNPTFNGNIDTTYVVTGTANNGCTSKDTVNINVNIPNSFVQPPSKSFCKNEFVVLDGYNGINAQYNWTGPNLSNSNIINPTANPLNNTIYQVSIFDSYCNSTQTFIVPVNVLPLPIINLEKSNDVNCIVPSAELLASGAIKYLWSPAQTLNDSTIKNPLATPNITTIYTVDGTDNNGCIGTNNIILNKDNSFGIINLPNIFTPNKDGKNDCFKVLVKGQIKNYTLIIFNRWGVKVFETHNSNDCWDGKFKGMEVETGNYVYYLTAKTLCGEFTKKGNVILIR